VTQNHIGYRDLRDGHWAVNISSLKNFKFHEVFQYSTTLDPVGIFKEFLPEEDRVIDYELPVSKLMCRNATAPNVT